jgi:hypothetical protein
MKFKIQTLVDITHTGAGRQEADKIAYRQEANFQTVLQTVGLRANLEFEKSPVFEEVAIAKIGFSDKYKGKQRVWSFEFEIPFEGALTLDMLNNDFNLIPFIPGLTETAKFEQAIFRTTPQERNIVFSIIE